MYGYSCLFSPLSRSLTFFFWLYQNIHVFSPPSFLSLFSSLLRFAISSFLCGLHHEKKRPVLWMWKGPVFNFWETHKSLSLLSYWPQNWKQMLPYPPLPPALFELPNYGVVKIKITLSISLPPSLTLAHASRILFIPHGVSFFFSFFLLLPFFHFFFVF